MSTKLGHHAWPPLQRSALLAAPLFPHFDLTSIVAEPSQLELNGYVLSNFLAALTAHHLSNKTMFPQPFVPSVPHRQASNYHIKRRLAPLEWQAVALPHDVAQALSCVTITSETHCGRPDLGWLPCLQKLMRFFQEHLDHEFHQFACQCQCVSANPIGEQGLLLVTHRRGHVKCSCEKPPAVSRAHRSIALGQICEGPGTKCRCGA